MWLHDHSCTGISKYLLIIRIISEIPRQKFVIYHATCMLRIPRIARNFEWSKILFHLCRFPYVCFLRLEPSPNVAFTWLFPGLFLCLLGQSDGISRLSFDVEIRDRLKHFIWYDIDVFLQLCYLLDASFLRARMVWVGVGFKIINPTHIGPGWNGSLWVGFFVFVGIFLVNVNPDSD
jgi:hypothetical protein